MRFSPMLAIGTARIELNTLYQRPRLGKKVAACLKGILNCKGYGPIYNFYLIRIWTEFDKPL